MMTTNINIVLLNGDEEKYTFPTEIPIKKALQHICKKHGLNPSHHVLSYNNFFLSQNLQLKTLNFHNEETLEIKEDFRPRNNETVKIILQIKDCKTSSLFHPDVTLWKVVNNLVASIALQIPYSTPILIRKRVEYIGYELLNEVTPRSLGVTNGTLFFRFLMIEDDVLSKRTKRVLGSEESMQFELSKVYELRNIYGHKLLSTESVFEFATEDYELTFAPGIERRGSSIFEELNYLGDRNAIAFRLPDGFLQNEEPDDFYVLAQDDVQVIYKTIYNKRKELIGKLLRPDGKDITHSQIDTERTVIRIEFPDRTVLQGIFYAQETIKDVEEFIKEYRRIPKDFKLIVAPPKIVLDSEKTLASYELVPNGKIYYTSHQHPERTAYLKENVLRQLSTHEAACYAAALCKPIFPGIDSEDSDYIPSTKSNNTFSSERKVKFSYSSLDTSERQGYALRPFRSRRISVRKDN